MTESAFFQDLAILMAAAGLVGVVFSRLKWPKVLGYILAGVVMSEHTWGGSFLADAGSVRTIGQLGVVFLMFSMGLSFSARDMKKIRSVALPAAVLDTVVMIWLGYMVGTKLLGWSATPSLFLGVAICDSATTLLAKVIGEMGWGRRPFAKYVLGISVCEDIICVGAIAVATGFAHGGGMSAGAFVASLGWLAVFFLSVLVFGFVFVPRLLKSIAKQHDDEALLLALLGTCFLVCYLAYVFDFSTALGAFLVGILGSVSTVRERLGHFVEPLKSMFAAVFFVSIGLLVDPVALGCCLPQILLVSVVVVGGKLFNCTLASLATGLDVKTALQNGFSLAQIGEFAFMVAILYAGLVTDTTDSLFQIAVGVSLLTTLLNPFLIRLSDRVGDWAERRLPRRFATGLDAYRAWLAKIGSSAGSPAYGLLKAAVVKLGIYAVLMVAVSTSCALLYRFDYSRFSQFFERYDAIFFFYIANVFSVALLPMIIAAARSVGDAVAVLLGGDGNARWQISLRPFVRFVALTAVLVLYFVEWSMLNVAIAPPHGWSQGVVLLVIVITAAVGWRYFLKAGRRATERFTEALTAEEREESLRTTMAVALPEGQYGHYTIPAGSPAIGGSVVTLNIRARTGASVVSVVRDGETYRNVGPEWLFCAGDVVTAIGEASKLASLEKLLGVEKA